MQMMDALGSFPTRRRVAVLGLGSVILTPIPRLDESPVWRIPDLHNAGQVWLYCRKSAAYDMSIPDHQNFSAALAHTPAELTSRLFRKPSI
jgi:hypothetical protein